MMGSDGLISYWYLGRAFNQILDPDTVRLRRDMRNNTGGIMAAPLAIAAPETGGWRDREVIPAPVTYGLHILDDARDVAEIRVSRGTVRRGAKMGFSRSLITDAADSSRVIAVTTGVGVTLGDAPPSFRPVDVPPQLPDTADLPPLHVVFGAQRTTDGWRLPALTSRHASTSASLHLGPIHVVFEAPPWNWPPSWPGPTPSRFATGTSTSSVPAASARSSCIRTGGPGPTGGWRSASPWSTRAATAW